MPAGSLSLLLSLLQLLHHSLLMMQVLPAPAAPAAGVAAALNTASCSCCHSDCLCRLASEDDQEEVQMEAEEGSGWPEDSMVM